MAATSLNPAKIAHFIKLRERGISINQGLKTAGIANATYFRQVKDPLSAINLALGKAGMTEVAGPDLSELSTEARRAYDDFGYFRQRYFARATNPWAEDAAYKMVELSKTNRKEYVVVNIAPGVGKSTVFTHDLPAWLGVRNRALRQMIGSSSQKLANGYTAQLRNTFSRTVHVKADPHLKALGLAFDAKSSLLEDFGRFRPNNSEIWRRDEFTLAQVDGSTVTGKESSFVAFGMDADYLGGRFDVVVWDDLVTDEIVKSEKARAELEHKWDTVAESRLDPNGLLILQGQRLASNDLYRYALDLLDFDEAYEIDVPAEKAPKKYFHIVYKSHYEELCEGKHAKDAPAYLKGGCLLDPYRLPYRELMSKKMNKEENFRVVYQQEDVDAAASFVQRVWIDGGKDEAGVEYFGCWDDRSAGIVPSGMSGHSVLSVDPSPTKYWGCLWWIYSPDTQMQNLIDIERRSMTASDFLDYDQNSRTFTGYLEDQWVRSNAQHRPITHLIVEENAAQRFMSQYNHFRAWLNYRGVQLVPHQTQRNKSNPEFGVQTLPPHYKFGRVRLPGNKTDGSWAKANVLAKEVCAYKIEGGGTDDTVMAHWFLMWNAPRLFPAFYVAPPKKAMPTWMDGRGARAV